MSTPFTDDAPRYIQIAALMRQRVVRGQWPVGHRLPSLDELGVEFGVARVTVRQAMDALVREGLVSARRGRGTFVTAQPARRQWLTVQTTLEALADAYRDDKPQIVTIDESVTQAPIRAEDGASADRYVYMRRVHSKDGEPYSVVDLYLADSVFRRDPERFRTETVIPILAAMKEGGVHRAEQSLSIGTADMQVARHLNIPVNSPVAEVRRVFLDAAGTVIYLGEVTYRGDFIRLQMVLK